MAVPLRRAQVVAVFEVSRVHRASLQAGVAFDAGGELVVVLRWVLIEVVALRHASETAPHLAGNAVTADHQIGQRRQRVHRTDTVAFANAGATGETGSPVYVDGTDSAVPRTAAVAKGEVWHHSCLCLQEHVEDHGLLVRIAACIVVFHDGSLTVAMGFDLDLHAARFSATAASSEPGSTSGAAPSGDPIMAW